MCTLWRAEDGSLALVIANFSEQAASFPLSLELKDYASDSQVFRGTYDMINNIESDVIIENQRINENIDLEPLEIKIIEISM
jgi:hypothetical protein